jgi:hypothetical protein
MAKGVKTGGRQKGTPNKVTKEVKEMVLEALDEAGGVAYLKARALDTPGPFLSLLGKVLPMQITGEGGGPVKTVARIELIPLGHSPDSST